ncbi:small secreted domain DUF320 [Stackebrandtia endophytica]|uniref:Small secreted domain DUF320 n=1 Tax=Stackebrandtia endophytica TaxID=1496996 RepID=A0A543AX94_9ACTN|nr:chaplin [Stackebrandtia endophytica]TQL77196.1 small secreted domain DUF320 [Stackebrandtia endophytica]
MSKRILRNASLVGAMAAGAVLMAGGAAHAGTDIVSTGNQGVANGNQVVAPIQVPINVCGNAVGALVGVAGAGCHGGSDANLESASYGKAEGGTLGDMVSSGNNGVLNGTQLQAPIQVPIDVCGNAIAVVGAAGAGCHGGADAEIESGHYGKTESGLGDMVSAGNNGVLNGTQLQAPIQVPVDVCGNAIGALVGVAGAGCHGGSDANLESASYGKAEGGTLGDMVSAGNQGILNGTQLQLPVQVPVDISGNAIAVAGVAGAGSHGGSDANLG